MLKKLTMRYINNCFSYSALPNDDYIPLDRSVVTFSSDDAYQTVTINLIDDQIVQGTRSFGVALEVDNTTNLFPDRADGPILIGDGLATVYINDDDTMATDCELKVYDLLSL